MATRRERVILELQDDFTTDMAKAAAATALLNRELHSLSGTAVQTSRDSETAARATEDLGDEVKKTSTKTRDGAKDIDRYSGRLRLLTEAAVTLGTVAIPIGAVAVPAVAGLAAGLGAAAGAAGVAILAFHGIGDALKALDAYQLDPTTAHLEKMREEFEKVGPTGVAFVKFLDDLEPELKSLQEVARAGLFPGVEAGITSLLTMFPQVRTILFSLSSELGRLTASAGAALSGPGFAAFFDYLETDAAPTLEAFAHTLGFVTQGLTSLLVAFAPLSADFASGLEAMSRSFAHWAANLSETDGFRGFVDYVRRSGPQVLSLLGSLSTAFVAIAQAAAPVGDAVLPALTALARVLALIAQSPIGPPLFTAVAAMLALNRATTLATKAFDKFKVSAEGASAAGQRFSAGISFAAILTGIGLVNEAFNKLDERIDANNLGRNIEAFAGGQNVENLDNLGKSLDIAASHMARFEDVAGAILTLNFDDSTWEKAKEDISTVDQALAGLVESGRQKEAAAAFARIAAQADAEGVSLENVKAAFSAYQTALENAKPSADEAAQAARKVAQAHNQQSASADKAADSTKGLVDAMQEETKAALGAFDAETQYRQALKDAAAQAKKNEAGIRGNSDAALKNRSALSSLAAAWNGQSDAVKNNEGRYRQARKDFLDTADAMNVPIAKAKALADRILDIPTSYVLKAEAKTDPAIQAALRLKAAVEAIPTSWSTVYTMQTLVKPELHAPAGSADGSTVPKDGGPYADRFLYALAPGEEVISNRHGQADRHRGLLKAINAGHLAGGGTAGSDGHSGKSDKPLFSHEGPHWYAAAYRHNKPFALDGPSHWDWPYQTALTRALAREFERWVIGNHVPFDPSARISDYDMRGYWKKTRGRGWHQGSHFPDTFKTPYDTTFSHESKYASPDNPFYWHGDKLIDTRNGQVVFAEAGGTVPKTGMGYADRHPYMLADGEEVISNRYGQADRHRSLLKAINAGHLADGGTAGGTHLSLDDKLAIVQALQQIRDLRRELAKDGKKRVEGLDRRLAELQIQAAQKEIRLAETRAERDARQEARDKAKEGRNNARELKGNLVNLGAELSFDSLVPSAPQTVTQGVQSEIADFRKQILDAGGEWSKALKGWARDMVAAAKEYDATQASIVAEQTKRDDLVKTLEKQQSQLDQLNSTMAAFSASVAGNFLKDGFNGAHTVTPEGRAGPATAALASAQAQLAAIRSGPGGDSVAAAAQASALITQIAQLQAAASAETAPVEQTVSGLDALRETLTQNTADALAFAQALQTLADKGLSTDGLFSGFYQQLASSGDLATAQQLAALTPEEIQQFELLFAQNQNAAAALAAQTTQAVYGPQQALLQQQIDQTNALIAQSDATLTILNAELAVLGGRVKQGAQDGVLALQPQINQIIFGLANAALTIAELQHNQKP